MQSLPGNLELLPWWVRVPGKALLSGGYAIVYQDQPGLSLALDAFYFVNAIKSESKSENCTVVVCNPQFPESDFRVIVEDSEKVQVFPSSNRFISATLKVLLRFLKLQGNSSFRKYDFKVTILQSANFYATQGNESSLDFNPKSPLNQSRFLQYKHPLSQTPKNGFGSSACLIVALMSSLLRCLNISSFDDKSLLYLLSLLANFDAQQKIGSGFDIGKFFFN